jgi:K+-transporting ATPase ATPase A chain
MGFAWTIVALVAVLAICWRFFGSYMAAVFEHRVHWLALAERPIYRIIRTSREHEQAWPGYAMSMTIFSAVALAVSYAIFRLQGVLPFNPQHLPAVSPALAWNTSVSFVTNTNWQAYAGESTMSYLSQMGALAVQNFLSAAVGLAVAVALIRGFARRGARTSGTSGSTWSVAPCTSCCRSPSWPRSCSSPRARCRRWLARSLCTTR